MHKKITALEKFSIKLSGWIGTPFVLIIHTLLIAGILGLRFFGIITDSAFLGAVAAVSLGTVYLVVFIQVAINRNTAGLAETQRDMKEVLEEEKEAHKVMINILHLAHQMKKLQEDIDSLKKTGILKQINGNNHRVHA